MPRDIIGFIDIRQCGNLADTLACKIGKRLRQR
jgi:hypothetical protein